MALKKSLKRRKIIAFWVLVVLAFVWIFPLLWLVGTSFKSQVELGTNPLGIIPLHPVIDNYRRLFSNLQEYPIFDWLRNSAIVSVLYTLFYVVIISLAAYAFAIMKWKGRNVVFSILLLSMMVPTIINTIPLLQMVMDFGWLDDLIWYFVALIAPGLGGVFGLFIVKQFFQALPYELVEAAKMEGASNLQILFKIVLPLGKSSVMVAGLFAFMGSWNDYLWPTLLGTIINSSVTAPGFNPRTLYTLQYGLSTMASKNAYDNAFVIAGAVLSIVPILVVFLCVQNKIIEGVARTGIK
jgi:multiple sugar transport system permease protein